MIKGVKTVVLITLAAAAALSVLFVSGCKKEEKITPDLTFFAPYASQWFDFGDTIWVDAQIGHPEMSRVTLTLVNSNFQPVEAVSNIQVNGSDFRFQNYIEITNKTIETGIHNVRIQVTAQGESYNFFRQVQIGELAKERKAVYVATSDGINRQLYRIENGQQVLSQSLFGDASGVAVNSFYGGVYLAPSFHGDLLLFNPPSDSLVWRDENDATGGAAFIKNVYSTGNAVYGLYQDGRVVEYGNNGGVASVIQLPSGARPLDMILLDNYLLIVAQKEPQLELSIYFYNATTMQQIRKLDVPAAGEFIAILPYASGQFAFLYNDKNQKAAWDSYLTNGTFIAFPPLPSFLFLAAAAVGDGNFALGTDQGIFHYNKSVSGYLSISPIQPSILEYDYVRGEIMVGTGKSMSIRSYPSFQIISTHSFLSEIKGIDMYYNK